jgi:hypothetical protein
VNIALTQPSNLIKQIKFNVFGMHMLAEGRDRKWRFYYCGSEGKRRPANDIAATNISESELEQYLDDIFHEMATSGNSTVKREE